jgi:hypothetical protein
MSDATAPIAEAKSSNVGQLTFEVKLTTADGSSIAGQDVRVSLEGDGSLAPRFDAKEVVRETNAEGVARATWYRRGIFGRDVKAQISATSPIPDSVVTLRSLSREEAPAAPRTGWAPETPLWKR